MAFCLPGMVGPQRLYQKTVRTPARTLGGQVNILALDMYDGKEATTPQEAGQYVRGVVEKNKAKQFLWIT